MHCKSGLTTLTRIETQEQVFKREKPVSRFIELGPSKILGGMAKRTHETKFADIDTSRGIFRQYLSSSQDLKDIYYDYEELSTQDPNNLKDDKSSNGATRVESRTIVNSAALGVRELPPASTYQPPKVKDSVPDLPVSAIDITRSLIAYKLRKSLEDVSVVSSIKELCGGTS